MPHRLLRINLAASRIPKKNAEDVSSCVYSIDHVAGHPSTLGNLTKKTRIRDALTQL